MARTLEDISLFIRHGDHCINLRAGAQVSVVPGSFSGGSDSLSGPFGGAGGRGGGGVLLAV